MASRIGTEIKRHLYPDHLPYYLAHALLISIGLIAVLIDRSNAIYQAIGTSLIATGAAGFVVYSYVRIVHQTAERLQILTQFGFVRAFAGRSVQIKPEYDRRLSHASEQIDIMAFGLRALREDYRDSFVDWSRRAKVRILLIDPHAPIQATSYADQRDIEERNPPGTIRADVRQFLNAVHQVNPPTDRFEIRLSKTLPSVNIFRIDDQSFWGPYLMREQSRNMPTFIVERGGVMFDALARHFEEIWSDDTLSRPAPSVDAI